MDQFLADTFGSHSEPVWVLEVRPEQDRWLGSNPAACELLEQLSVPDDNLEVVLGSLGVPRSLIMGGLHTLGSFSTSTGHGILHVTRVTADYRPALMVASLHNDCTEAHAWNEHTRLVTALRVNEEAQGAIAITQSAVRQLQGVVANLQSMLDDFNQEMQQTDAVPRQLTHPRSERPLTSHDEAMQG